MMLKTAKRLKRADFWGRQGKKRSNTWKVFRAFLTKPGAKRCLLRLFILVRMRRKGLFLLCIVGFFP
jgi:hypothetical protein